MKPNLDQIRGIRDVANLMLPYDLYADATISLRNLINRHRFRPVDQRSKCSARELLRRWNSRRGARAVSCVFYNTFLMKVTLNIYAFLEEQLPGENWFEAVVGALGGFVVGGPAGAWAGALGGLEVSAIRKLLEQWRSQLSAVDVGSATDVEARASEIGRQLADHGFDIASLCEVWRREDLNRIADSVRSRGKILQIAGGPERTSQSDVGSGLVVLAMPASPIPNQQFKVNAVHVFNNRGEKNKDSDAWGSKAVILTCFDTGVGMIDLYTTHLYSGNDLPSIPPFLATPDQGHKDDVKAKQCDELRDFIQATHNPSNVAIIVGDFNIVDSESIHYKLQNLMDALQFKDQVIEQWSKPFQTSQEGRIDYILIEAPKDTHTFNVDILPVRLFSPPGPINGQLSDHQGLDFMLLCGSLG